MVRQAKDWNRLRAALSLDSLALSRVVTVLQFAVFNTGCIFRTGDKREPDDNQQKLCSLRVLVSTSWVCPGFFHKTTGLGLEKGGLAIRGLVCSAPELEAVGAQILGPGPSNRFLRGLSQLGTSVALNGRCSLGLWWLKTACSGWALSFALCVCT
eukprot:114883-Amphidinium_carterae.1